MSWPRVGATMEPDGRAVHAGQLAGQGKMLDGSRAAGLASRPATGWGNAVGVE